MNRTVSSKIYDLLKNVVTENIEHYAISVDDPNKKGEGYLGEMCYISLKNKSSSEVIDLVIKQAFSDENIRGTYPIRGYYLNEVHFYSKVWPCFKKFQTERCIPHPFDKIPNCFATSLELGHEKLALENLKKQHFQTYDKKKPFDDEHLTFILKEYGKFHAVSFAYKLLHPEEYHELTKGLEDHYGGLTKIKYFTDYVTYVCQLSLKSLDEEDKATIEKFKDFCESCIETFRNRSNYYFGDYSVILHGDCWSNNMMMKYDQQKRLCDLRLLDFQLSKVGTPVCDLSYFLYSGGSKDTFDRLDHYLNIYHNSLLSALGDFGLNSNNIYPFEVLKEDWKKYYQTGFLMGLLSWRSRLETGENMDLTDIKGREDDFVNEYAKSAYDQEAFKTRTRDLIVHMAKNDFL